MQNNENEPQPTEASDATALIGNEEKQDTTKNTNFEQELIDEKQDEIESSQKEATNETGTKEDATNENAATVITATATATANENEDENDNEKANGNEQEANEDAINATRTIISEEELNQLKKYLPYFHEFINKPEHSVLSMGEYKENPDLYLQAILSKYNVEHPKTLQSNDPKKSEENLSAYREKEMPLRPWIEGVLDKLMPEKNMFGQAKWQSRLFRLFDEALVWFDEPNMVAKWWARKELTMKPLGVLPLAMVTSIETADLSESNTRELSEDELLTLTLHIGDEGVIILRCSDVNQRLKWFECLHCAVFNVPKPLFATKEGIWRIAEETVNDTHKQWTKHAIQEQMHAPSSMDKIRHVRMGTSLVVSLRHSFVGVAAHQVPVANSPTNTQIDSQNTPKDTAAVELQNSGVADLQTTEKRRESHLRKDSKVL